MLVKSNGYFLLELLLTLSIFFVTTLTILPMCLYVEKQTLNARLEREALRLLHDKIQSYIINGDTTFYEVMNQGSGRYELTLDLSTSEGCVNYNDAQNKKQTHCASFK